MTPNDWQSSVSEVNVMSPLCQLHWEGQVNWWKTCFWANEGNVCNVPQTEFALKRLKRDKEILNDSGLDKKYIYNIYIH